MLSKVETELISTCNLFLNVLNSSNICYYILYGLNSSEVELKDPQVHARASDQACMYRSGWIKANMFQVWLVHWVTLLIYSALRTNYSVQWEVSTSAWIQRFPIESITSSSFIRDHLVQNSYKVLFSSCQYSLRKRVQLILYGVFIWKHHVTYLLQEYYPNLFSFSKFIRVFHLNINIL